MPFIKGLELSKLFYWQAVRPILDRIFPGLNHSAALIGSGSEVLGFDTEMSTDHHWGPRLLLFVPENENLALAEQIWLTLANELPVSFLGFSTNFSTPNPDDNGVQLLTPIDSPPVNHRVEVFTIRSYFKGYLGLDPTNELSARDWLTLEEQRLRTVVAGEVFYDGLGELEPIRAKLGFYPADLWLYLLASEWQKIGQEEPFVGRCGTVGDDLGSRLVAARLVHTLMRLGFLMEKQYAPYSKWFGTAFNQLACAAQMGPVLAAALAAQSWPEREEHLCQAYLLAACLHNSLQITPPMPEQPGQFFGRPFRVISGELFAQAIHNAITDPEVLGLPPHIGSVNQFVSTVDVLSNPQHTRNLAGLYNL